MYPVELTINDSRADPVVHQFCGDSESRGPGSDDEYVELGLVGWHAPKLPVS
jgi:hypothetical protein